MDLFWIAGLIVVALPGAAALALLRSQAAPVSERRQRAALITLSAVLLALVSLLHIGSSTRRRKMPALFEEDSESGHLVLTNPDLRLVLDARSGRIISVVNRARGIELIGRTSDSAPWRVALIGRPGWLSDFTHFTWRRDARHVDGVAIDLRWETAVDLTIHGRVELRDDEPDAFFWVTVENRGQHSVDKIEYPIFAAVGSLGDRPDADVLVHGQGTGFLFRDPLHLFRAEEGRGSGLRYSPYPEGFSGAALQMMAYYADGRGGFYFATRDPNGAMKWLNFFKDSHTDELTVSFMHQSPDLAEGNPLVVPYPILVGVLVEGTWYEAADRYKAWAVRQKWTQQGKLVERRDRPRWLLEEVGLVTFGINASHDRSHWLQWFHSSIGTTVFHILGPNWAKFGQDYVNHLPRSRDDWFPATFNPQNLEAIRRVKDYWAPFEFDLLSGWNGSLTEPVLESRQLLPEVKYSFDAYNFPFMCPVTRYWHDLHVWRDHTLVKDYDVDGNYYDISVNNVLPECLAVSHGHPKGGGRWMVEAYARMFADTKAATTDAKGRVVPMGTEMITELFIPFFDYYQARAEASPASAFEADFFREWIKAGQAEKIPLFAYVYHEYGPVRLDGWGKLSKEQGDLFYWIASRVTLWGGIFELNYEYSPLETLDGETEPSDEHYYPFEAREYAIDPAKVAFLSEIAVARTGFARDYLAYGTMLRPLAFETPRVSLSYFLYNCFRDSPDYEDRGMLTVPAVLHAAWRYKREKAGFLFSNIATHLLSVRVAVNPSTLGLDRTSGLQVSRIDRNGAISLGPLERTETFDIEIPPRRIVLLEVRPT